MNTGSRGSDQVPEQTSTMIITTSTEKEEKEEEEKEEEEKKKKKRRGRKEVRKATQPLLLHRSHPQRYLCRSSDVNYQQRKKGQLDQKSQQNAIR
jgi:hypothetical protein